MSVAADVTFGLDSPIDGTRRRRPPRRGRASATSHLRAVPPHDLHEHADVEPASRPTRDDLTWHGERSSSTERGSSLLETGAVPAGRTRPGVASEPAQGWRLTRRGRVVVLGLLVALLTAGTVGFGAARALSAATAPVDRQVKVVVAEGDTLWTIAASVAPRGDRKDTVERIRKANHLRGSHIEPGQQLVVPVVAR